MARTSYEGMAAYIAGRNAGIKVGLSTIRDSLQDFIDAKDTENPDPYTKGGLTLARLYRDLIDDALKEDGNNDGQN